jgi:NAD(P)H dehydrogenase (quinone)
MEMDSDKTPILVTGATGRQGGSGRAVLKGLLERGLPVRALVRIIDERAEALRSLGAEVVLGDFMDYASLLAALRGVKSAYFCYPVTAGIAEAAGLFATAGRAQSLERIVDLSLGSTRPDAASPQVRAQWVAEKIFEWAGFGGVHLRIAAFFMENVTLIDGYTIREKGIIANAFGDVSLSWISGADVGAMAASLLANPDLTSERVLVSGGVEQLSYREIAATVSTVVGRPVPYQELTPEAWRIALIAASATAGEPNIRGADHLVAQAIAIRSAPRLPVPDQVRRLTGRPAISLADFVESRRAELTPGPWLPG